MEKRKWKTYALFILLSEAVGVVSGLLTRGGMENYDSVLKPALTPPAIVFPIVWTILFALMGIGAARVALSETSRKRTWALIVFGAQLIVNFFWSIIFFNLQLFGFAFFWLLLLWALIAAMIVLFGKVDRAAALLQIPYLLWVTFAGYLSFSVWMLNG